MFDTVRIQTTYDTGILDFNQFRDYENILRDSDTFGLSQINPNIKVFTRPQREYKPKVEVNYYNYNGLWLPEKLTIELSVPKALYGSNYFSSDEKDLIPLCNYISKHLSALGFNVPPRKIVDFELTTLAVCHNFIIPLELGESSELIEKYSPLFKFGYGKKDKTTNYNASRNGGLCIRQYSQNNSYKIYSKVNEIKGQKKLNETEQEILRLIELKEIPSNILRIERTLQNKKTVKAKINQILNTKKARIKLKDGMKKEVFIALTREFLDAMGSTENIALSESNDTTDLTNIMQTLANKPFSCAEYDHMVIKTALTNLGGKAHYTSVYDKSLGRKGQKYRSKINNSIKNKSIEVRGSSTKFPEFLNNLNDQFENLILFNSFEEAKSINMPI